ncbi:MULTISPECIES: DUF2098 domain-containing protein [Methanobacterium]|jgi:hypothetical protein|uniref:DUF2098 family protein n=1 Tax=Methanobacterium veterum TaxID=408577 RepID=A0A9E5A0V7_9EURY|nr:MULTISPECIES: DUF2098 family protein [Methanobacterium]MCZ3365690.1 DUF2098 family protein [Methanobacterium veterum]MCZ3371154.1 DUF2098 family protein [Methanobacterium veterum]
MEILDINGKQIQRNLQVKYIRTHTTGNVIDILVKEDAIWIKLDSSGLYYRSDYIEVIENNEAYIKSYKKKNRLRSGKFDVANPAVISDHADGPGYGGG